MKVVRRVVGRCVGRMRTNDTAVGVQGGTTWAMQAALEERGVVVCLKCAAGAVVEAKGWVGRESTKGVVGTAADEQRQKSAAGRASRRLKLLQEAAGDEKDAREAVAGIPGTVVAREMIKVRHEIWSDPLKWDQSGTQCGGAQMGLTALSWEAAKKHVHHRIHGKGLDLIGGVIAGTGGRKWCVVAVVAGSEAGGTATVWAIDTAAAGGTCKVLRVSTKGLATLSGRMKEARAAAMRGEHSETKGETKNATRRRGSDESTDHEEPGEESEELTAQTDATAWLEGVEEDEMTTARKNDNENEVVGIEDMEVEELNATRDTSEPGRPSEGQTNMNVASARVQRHRGIAMKEKNKAQSKTRGKSRQERPRSAD